jgi:uncharacterized membrane protein YfcA
MNVIIVSTIVCALAMLMTMTGRGGGNFYVLVLILAGQAIHHAAASGQLILMLSAVAGMLIFSKHKMIDWKLALVIDPPTDVMAFVGGYFSAHVSGIALKFLLTGLLVIAGFLMLVTVKDRPITGKKKLGYWHRRFGNEDYVVNLWLAIPITATVGLAAGAVGISGGSFKVPLMVLLCGVPMRIAVGTSSAMVAITALMGFAGHVISGHFDPQWAIPVACAGMLGGLIGGKLTVKIEPRRLKVTFAFTTFAAAIVMVINTLLAR